MSLRDGDSGASLVATSSVALFFLLYFSLGSLTLGLDVPARSLSDINGHGAVAGMLTLDSAPGPLQGPNQILKQGPNQRPK